MSFLVKVCLLGILTLLDFTFMQLEEFCWIIGGSNGFLCFDIDSHKVIVIKSDNSRVTLGNTKSITFLLANQTAAAIVLCAPSPSFLNVQSFCVHEN